VFTGGKSITMAPLVEFCGVIVTDMSATIVWLDSLSLIAPPAVAVCCASVAFAAPVPPCASCIMPM